MRASRRTSRCSGRSRRREIGVTSTNRSCGARAAERQGVGRTKIGHENTSLSDLLRTSLVAAGQWHPVRLPAGTLLPTGTSRAESAYWNDLSDQRKWCQCLPEPRRVALVRLLGIQSWRGLWDVQRMRHTVPSEPAMEDPQESRETVSVRLGAAQQAVAADGAAPRR